MDTLDGVDEGSAADKDAGWRHYAKALGPGLDHGRVGRRPLGHRDLRAERRAVPVRPRVGRARHLAAHVRCAGDLRPHRAHDRQGPRRADPGAVRPAHTRADRRPHRAADARERPQHGGRPRRDRAGHAPAPRRTRDPVGRHRRDRDHRARRLGVVRDDREGLQVPLPLAHRVSDRARGVARGLGRGGRATCSSRTSRGRPRTSGCSSACSARRSRPYLFFWQSAQPHRGAARRARGRDEGREARRALERARPVSRSRRAGSTCCSG